MLLYALVEGQLGERNSSPEKKDAAKLWGIAETRQALLLGFGRSLGVSSC